MFYFVCMNCTAKFFHNKDSSLCPRCGTELASSDEQNPPWIQHAEKNREGVGVERGRMGEETSEEGTCSTPTNTDGPEHLQNRLASSSDADQQRAWEIQYRIQLRRRLCPGCGEADDIPS
jgi:predicted RNA-binding Zn-ribbon protein involved in translation (DUF1610 family)